VWARALLKEDFGILPRDVTWVRGGIETPGRAEKLKVQLAADVKMEQAPETDTLSAMLDRGDLDAFIGPRAPSCFGRNPEVQWLYPDPTGAAQDYYRRTAIFPIMHVLGVRRELAAQHPWLPVALFKAFDAAKDIALRRLADPSAPKTSLPFLEEQITAAQRLMGQDYWPNGVAANRKTLEAFLAHHHDQGLSQRKVSVDELFAPTTYELAKI
jgi:4,5-dihydroxyphthalate decarboxylase